MKKERRLEETMKNEMKEELGRKKDREEKEKERQRRGIMKSNKEEQKQGSDNVKEKKRENGDKEMESNIEEEISGMKGKEEKEKEMQTLLNKEKKNKEKIQGAKNVLLGAILLEQMLSIFMQDMQDEEDNREFGMWPEEIRENTAWDIQKGYCLEDSQDTGWDMQPEIHAWSTDDTWLW